jgi:transposase InsO family protein
MRNLAELQEMEAHRRLKLLATTIEDPSGTALHARAQQIGLPVAVLRQWHASYLHRGFDALLPPWSDISEPVWTLIEQRYSALGDLAEAETLKDEDIDTLATSQGWTTHQATRWLGRYRAEGMMGLAPASRPAHARRLPDLGTLSEQHRDAPVRFVYEQACQHAVKTGERAPGLWQVRSICAQIPAPVRLLADGREEEFRNRYRLTYPIAHDPHRIVWQIDHKAPVHVLVRDLRAPSHRSLSGEVRPYLTLVIDSASRLVMAGLLSYDAPDRFMVAAAIRAGMLITEHKPFGGVPDEIWVDNGKDLIAHHVSQLVAGLGSTLEPGPPHYPELRGIVERFHKTLDTRLWAT